jgi:hypothetical protein
MGGQDDEKTGFDEPTGRLLTQRSRAKRKRLGPEPDDLELVANWLDGTLGEAEGHEVERRVQADPELSAVVAELRRHEASDPKSVVGGANVVSLAAHRERAGRADVVGVPSLGASPERTRRSPGLQRIVLSIGGVVAIAAIVFIVTRPAAGPVDQGTAGAGLGVNAAEVTLTATYVDRATCAIGGTLAADGERRIWSVGAAGAVDLGVTKPGAFTLKSERCVEGACGRLVALPIAAAAPAVDAACEVTNLPSGSATVRLD